MRLTLPLVFLVFTFAGLGGCGGVSGENGSDPFRARDTLGDMPYSISVDIFNAQCASVTNPSFTSGDTLCIQALLSQDGAGVSGEIVSFSTGLGNLSVSSKLTDNEGMAEITLFSDSATVGASTISAIFDVINADANFEFIAQDITVRAPPSIRVSMLNNGQAVNRFQADETVQLQGILADATGMPIEGEIIVFTAGKGALNTTDALTDNQGIARVTLTPASSDIGAMVVSAQSQIDNLSLLASINVEIQPMGTINEDVIRFGHFNKDKVFIEGEMGVSVADNGGSAEISAGGTLGVSVAIVDENDQRILRQSPVQFNSDCVANGLATIDLQVNTINGEAQATFEDISCAGSAGNTDLIVASLVVNDMTVSIFKQIDIQAESIGSLQFISASPHNIVLLGAGGQNGQSVSSLVFQVNGALGNPLSQQTVNFSLNTNTGGLSLSPDSGITNSQGQVSTRVTAGNVPTAVRVMARTSTTEDIVISTQSDLLSVSTGLPDQNSFTFSADDLNPEGQNINGVKVTLVARLADTFNNPVPDGTVINFTTEGGSVEPSCTSSNGTCNVIWNSANPKVADHRITILATAIGHETLFDSNGNNSYDNADGAGFTDGTDSGFGNSRYGRTGFVDHSEAWRDDNENGVRDTSEVFLDYNNSGGFDEPDTFFNGPQCLADNACEEGSAKTLHVRKALVLVTSSSNALLDIVDASDAVIFSNHQNVGDPSLSLAPGESMSFTLRYSDTAIQPIASGSTIAIASTAGLIGGQTSLT
ncbi:MAG: hypothetical protein ACI965_002043, partial [Paraglaciecola sp.]